MTKAIPRIGQDWCARSIASFNGMGHTHIDTGEDYPTISLYDVFTMEPGQAEKSKGLACIPSVYHEYDARCHKTQQERGAFVALAADIDSGNHSLATIQSTVVALCKGAAWLIYSSAHATAGDMRWRIFIPTADALAFEDWNDAQNALFNLLDRAGFQCDRALERAGQPVFLPNVPEYHGKTGERLRAENGSTLYFQTESSGCAAPALDITTGPIAAEIALIRQHREADERERERIRAEAERRRMERATQDGASIIDEFNANNSIRTLFELYGYEQSPRNGDDWRSPMQTSESYATRIYGDRWVSLSGSDTGARIGHQFKGGCFGDAYDLFLHFEHGGDQKSAFRTLYGERRSATLSPPPVATDDPGWSEPPLGPDEGDEIAIVPPVIERETDELGFNLTDWSTDKFYGKAPEIEWLCEGTIPLGVPALFAAMGGVGKSFISLDLALQIADTVAGGKPRKVLGGEVVAHGSVVVLSAEDSAPSVHRRLERIDPDNRRERANGKVFIVPMPEVGGPMPLVTGDRGEFKRTAKFDALIRQLKQIPDLRLIVIDPLQAFVTADITKDPAAGQYMWSAFAQVCAETCATVIACHHMRKDGMNRIDSADAAREAIRGSTALIDGARASYALWAAGEEGARRVCSAAGVEYQPKRVVHGAVVKSNDEHDWHVHTYVRADSGLLEACDVDAAITAPDGDRLTQQQVRQVFNEIDERWRSEAPFSAAANAVHRYLPNWIRQQFGTSKKTAKEHLEEWMIGGLLVSQEASKKSKLHGLKVQKWPLE